jgi:hypothetical protein
MSYFTEHGGGDDRRHAAATRRNREPILDVLRRVLPAQGTVLEIGSGTGEHAVYLAPRLMPRFWQPTDIEPANLKSIVAWVRESPSTNILPPISLDAAASEWPIEREPRPDPPVTAIFSANVIHISPWSVCLGLIGGAGRILPEGGVLALYGPFKMKGRHTAPSNEAFDESLRARDPSWGVRDLTEIENLTGEMGLHLDDVVDMPANNKVAVFSRSRSS